MKAKITLEFDTNIDAMVMPIGAASDLQLVISHCVQQLRRAVDIDSKDSKALYDALWDRGFNVLSGNVVSVTVKNTDT